jgi:actin-related protein
MQKSKVKNVVLVGKVSLYEHLDTRFQINLTISASPVATEHFAYHAIFDF